jgi:hypothetical protein
MTSASNRFIINLKSFNRKERFFLVGWALGNREFRLDPSFRRELSSELELDVPGDAFVAMDYHLDWIFAGAFLSATDDPEVIHSNPRGLVSGSQEDMDLVVAFNADETAHLIMVEAKGVTAWTNKQATSKARRLEAIFGQRGNRWPHIRPHFVIVSPREPERLDCRLWPDWMKQGDGRPYWIEMRIPRGLLRVTRCDEAGKVTARGGYWNVVGSR